MGKAGGLRMALLSFDAATLPSNYGIVLAGSANSARTIGKGYFACGPYFP
jgi:hypothetical protein